MMHVHEASKRSAAIKHPFAALSFYLGNKSAMHRAIITDSAKYLFGKNTEISKWNEALDELESNELIPQNDNKFNINVGNNLNTTFGKWIWCTVRVLKPEIMIETGVAHGSSSWIILNAMHKNSKGRLISIDLPNKDTNKAYNFNEIPDTGWLVPEILKSRWDLHLGSATELLPELLKKYSPDIFFHDSDHSFKHMYFEFTTVIKSMKKGSIILSDDVHKNEAFEKFCSENQLKALRFNKGGAALVG